MQKKQDKEKSRCFFCDDKKRSTPSKINYDNLDEQLRNKLPNEFRNIIANDGSAYNRYFGDSYCGLYPDDGR